MARIKINSTKNLPSDNDSSDTLTVRKMPTSPCCKQCKLLPDNTCGGCFRTLQEIATWGMMTPQQKDAVRRRIEAKKSSDFS
jgi:predicted Fe-S protein YdhL (DUF1289 family)